MSAWLIHRRWGRTHHASAQAPAPANAPALTFFKPLKPGDPGATERVLKLLALISASDQIVVGITSDEISGATRQLMQVSDPRLDVIVCTANAGANPKVAKLIQMEKRAKNRFWVLTDSEVEPAPEWIAETRSRLSANPAALITAAYRFQGMQTFAEKIDAAAAGLFLWPGVVLRLAMGPPDFAFGALIAFDSNRFATADGFSSICNELADDHAMAAAWRRLGLPIALLRTVLTLDCDRLSLSGVWEHQQRVARTYRELAPCGFACAILLNPLAVAALGSLPLSGAHRLCVGGCVLGLRWLLRRSTAQSLREESCTYQPLVFIAGALMEACAWCASWLPLRVKWGDARLRVRAGRIE